VPPKDAIEIVASPVPKMAFTRRKICCELITVGLSTMIGATTGPVRGITFPFASGVFGASGAGVRGFAGGGGGGSDKYFNAKSETMPCFSETFALKRNDASGGIAKTRSPAMF